MDSRQFEELAKKAVNQVNSKITLSEMFIVWMCKTLQNNKALIGVHHSNKYYEVTYNGDKKEFYVDEYQKNSNTCIEESIVAWA